MLEKILINALKTDLTKGQMNNLVMIEERAFGKPKEKVEQTIIKDKNVIRLENGTEIEYD